MDRKILQNLEQVNWDFSDYNSMKYPLDINSLPWYPATFPPQIPRFLLSLLSKEGEVVLDPFGGKGTTAIETLKQNRIFLYNDINPFAVEMSNELINIIVTMSISAYIFDEIIKKDTAELKFVRNDIDAKISVEKDEKSILSFYKIDIKKELSDLGINSEVVFWYHPETLLQLVNIFKIIERDKLLHSELFYIRKFALLTILKETSSQRGHFTYVTDNCRPKKLIYYNAVKCYLNMLERIKLSSNDLLRQFEVQYPRGSVVDLINKSQICEGDARNLEWIVDESVDLVITSPPYLCAQDYIKTMRLMNFFFPTESFFESIKKEIGSRNRRNGKKEKVVADFYDDMNQAFREIWRTLKKNGYFCLIIGQGKGKISQGCDTIEALNKMLKNELNFDEIFRTSRKISFKSVRNGGVDTEEIIIFQKK